MVGRAPDHSIFAATQLEFGFALGPPDGRFLLRSDPDGDPERVLVLDTLGAAERRRLKRRRGKTLTEAEPEPVPTARATVIRAEPFESDEQARAWLESVRRDESVRQAETDDALRRLNRAVRAQRAAAGDPYLREVSLGQALVLRFGYGEGDSVAFGRFAEAWEAPHERRKVKRSMAAPEERFAALVGAREEAGVAEDLVLRARLDLDAGHLREAALQARVALEALLAESGAELSDRPRAELESDRGAVAAAASAALRGPLDETAAGAVSEAVRHMESSLRRLRLAG